MLVDYEVTEENDVQTLPITIADEGKGLLFSDVYSKVNYIPLETTEQSLVGGISKLEITNNGELIVLDRTRGSVILFNDRGKYICHIGKRGNGHGEYNMPADMVYDKYNNSVLVLDEGSNKILCYGTSGKFLSSIQLGFYISALTVLDNNHLCLYMNHYDDLTNRASGHNFKIISRNGHIISEFMDYDATMESFHPNSENVFFTMDSNNCFRQPYSSLIYSINEIENGIPNIISKYYIDFGEKKIPQDWYRLDFGEMEKKILQSDGIMYLTSVYKVTDRLIFNIVKNKTICLYILNLIDRSLDKFGFYAYNDIYGLVSSLSLSMIKDNKCYFIIPPSYFDRYKRGIEKGVEFYTVDKNFNPKVYVPSQKDRDLVHSIQDGDNPIIQVCTLKD